MKGSLILRIHVQPGNLGRKVLTKASHQMTVARNAHFHPFPFPQSLQSAPPLPPPPLLPPPTTPPSTPMTSSPSCSGQHSTTLFSIYYFVSMPLPPSREKNRKLLLKWLSWNLCLRQWWWVADFVLEYKSMWEKTILRVEDMKEKQKKRIIFWRRKI